jgi:Fic family protein
MRNLDKRIKDLPQSVFVLVSQIDELKGHWIGGAQLNPQLLGRLKRSTLVTSTGASTRIEGAKLSDEDVEKLMRGLTLQKFADRDKQEVRGYYELLENVFSAWQTIPFTESAIKHLHSELLKHVEKDELHRGEYKKVENRVEMINEVGESVGTLFDTTPAYLTPKEMQEVVEWTQEALQSNRYHPLLTIGAFLVEFLNIHPFQDGNGRLSRVLTNLLMLKTGYAYTPYVSHEKLIESNKPEYYLALRQSQKTFKTERETIVPWMEFFLRALLIQGRDAMKLMSSESVERVLSPKQQAVWTYLQSVPEATPKEIANATNIARPTVSQALTVLMRFNKIERIGQGRTTRYRKR